MYTQNAAIGAFNNAVPYWSSTEYDTNNAWRQNVVFGGYGHSSKANTYYVRSVRVF